MKTIEHRTVIDAPAPDVWAVLNDFAAYPEWNPFMTIEGAASTVGDRPTVTIRPGKRSMTFRPTVTRVQPGSSLAWLGRFLLPRVFDGAHEFIVGPLPDGRSRFIQRETFRGLLVPLMKSALRGTDAGFAAMNGALAARVALLALGLHVE